MIYLKPSPPIPATNPEKRFKYLANILKLIMIDHETIMGIATKQGKPVALLTLEKMFLELF